MTHLEDVEAEISFLTSELAKQQTIKNRILRAAGKPATTKQQLLLNRLLAGEKLKVSHVLERKGATVTDYYKASIGIDPVQITTLRGLEHRGLVKFENGSYVPA